MKEMKNLAQNIADIITEREQEKSHLLIAIDGRCASGKTTLSA